MPRNADKSRGLCDAGARAKNRPGGRGFAGWPPLETLAVGLALRLRRAYHLRNEDMYMLSRHHPKPTRMAMRKRYEYEQVTVSVPAPLKARMDALPRGLVTWSSVACRAFELAVTQLEKTPGRREATLYEVVHRLRGELRQEEGDDYLRGEACGKQWASDHARADQLATLADYRSEWRARGEWRARFEATNKPGELLASIVGTAPGEFWKQVKKPPERVADNPNFCRGFVDGCAEIWILVEPLL